MTKLLQSFLSIFFSKENVKILKNTKFIFLEENRFFTRNVIR